MTSKRIVVALLVLAITAPTVAGQAAPSTEPADLIVREPHYADGQVPTETANGTPVYVVEGESITIRPANFEAGQVVDYGVAQQQATLSFDSEFGVFRFAPEAEGTYRVYFVVNRQRVVNNTTTIVSVRYTALLRVTGGVGLVHEPQAERAALQAAAERGRDINQTFNEFFGPDGPQTYEAQKAAALRAMKLRYRPLAALSGGFTTGALLFLGLFGLGGAVWLLLFTAYPAAVVSRVRSELNLKANIEAEEGALTERLAAARREEQRQQFANHDHEDIVKDDHVAAALREATDGDTPLDTYTELVSTIFRPEAIVRDRLAAMHHAGWRATMGDDGYELDQPAEPDADAHIGLVDPPEDLLHGDDAIAWDCEAIEAFDPASVDVPLADLPETGATLDLEAILEAMDMDRRHFDSDEQAGAYLVELAEAVRGHELTDPDGRGRPVRWVLNHLLEAAQRERDLFSLPAAEYVVEQLEAALEHHDPTDQATATLDDIRSGRYDAGD